MKVMSFSNGGSEVIAFDHILLPLITRKTLPSWIEMKGGSSVSRQQALPMHRD